MTDRHDLRHEATGQYRPKRVGLKVWAGARAGDPESLVSPPPGPFGMRVPEGGSSCAKCEYLGSDGASCRNKTFVQFNAGKRVLPAPAAAYCCNAFDWNGR